jgi:hypothetical protein
VVMQKHSAGYRRRAFNEVDGEFAFRRWLQR